MVDQSVVAIDLTRDVLVHAAFAVAAPPFGLLNRRFRGFIAVDTGIGREEAGIRSLPLADEHGVPASSVNVYGCQMCAGRSAWFDGVINRVNLTEWKGAARPECRNRAAFDQSPRRHRFTAATRTEWRDLRLLEHEFAEG
jgi:hypothetical protein